MQNYHKKDICNACVFKTYVTKNNKNCKKAKEAFITKIVRSMCNDVSLSINCNLHQTVACTHQDRQSVNPVAQQCRLRQVVSKLPHRNLALLGVSHWYLEQKFHWVDPRQRPESRPILMSRWHHHQVCLQSPGCWYPQGHQEGLLDPKAWNYLRKDRLQTQAWAVNVGDSIMSYGGAYRQV